MSDTELRFIIALLKKITGKNALRNVFHPQGKIVYTKKNKFPLKMRNLNEKCDQRIR